MKFVEKVDKAEFDSFVASHPQKAHFMQSSGWGEFNKVERDLTPYYVGLIDEEENLIAAALLLKRKPFLFPAYFYSPRGFVIDFFNQDILKAFSKEIASFCKKEKAMFLKIDPDIELREINEDGSPLEGGKDNSFLIQRLSDLGFRHLGFNREFERRQPRYTFRIDLLQDKEVILSNIRGNVLKNVRKSEKNYVTEVCIGEQKDADELYRLIYETSKRDNYFAFPLRFYRNFYKVLFEHGMATLYLGKIYIQKTLDSLIEQLEQIRRQKESYTKPQRIAEAQVSESRLRKEIDEFSAYLEEYPDEIITCAHLVVHFANRAWAVHAGSMSVMNQTFLNNRVYLHKIMDQKDKGAVFFDQFGTVGSPNESRHRSLHEFKKQFGGRYIEFIGEFDMVFLSFWYTLYEKLLPGYRSILFDLKAFIRGLKVRLKGKNRKKVQPDA